MAAKERKERKKGEWIGMETLTRRVGVLVEVFPAHLSFFAFLAFFCG